MDCERGARTAAAARGGLFLALAILAAASGCSPAYVLRAGYEEAKILWRREPIATVLARSDLDPEVRRKLELVLAARRYAETIGLRVGGSFATLSYVDGSTVLYVLTATPRTSLEPHTWWFPIVGSVPYKGFFDRARAEAEAASLAARGFDTSIRGAAAFSTLGWFDDPLLRHQLEAGDVALVNLVLHESYHNTFYAKGAHATAFNESLATFVGNRAAIDFFAARPGGAALSAEARDAWEDERVFATFVQALGRRLRELYASADEATALAGRDAIFREALAAFPELPFHGKRFEKFGGTPLNNAVLLQVLLYTTDLDVFEAAAARLGGVRPALDLIEAAARREPQDPFGAVARALARGADASRAEVRQALQRQAAADLPGSDGDRRYGSERHGDREALAGAEGCDGEARPEDAGDWPGFEGDRGEDEGEAGDHIDETAEAGRDLCGVLSVGARIGGAEGEAEADDGGDDEHERRHEYQGESGGDAEHAPGDHDQRFAEHR